MSFTKEQIIALRKKVMEKEFARMNNKQKEAVFATEGPLLILAGAGSGKTTVIVNRIANIIRYGKAYDSDYVSPYLSEDNILECESYLNGGAEELSEETVGKLADCSCEPWRILAITFTNKAAGELKERLCRLLGENGESIWASTFHSTCARILRRDGDRLGYTNHFTIYDTDDSKKLLKNCLKELDIPEKILPVKSVMGEISRAKDELTTPEDFIAAGASDYRLELIGKVYELYQKSLKAANAMDFDDLLVNTVRLFTEVPEVLEYYRNKFSYIMVDEYQDTNHAQYMFVSLLAQKKGNICVVGDDDQSIYKFRGATIENILSFEKTFPGAKVIRLEQNYRSTQNILDAANKVISNNMNRKGKTLWTANGQGVKVSCYKALNERDEAEFIEKTVTDEVSKGRKFSDFAILYRANSQSNSLERHFVKAGIPYRIIGGTKFYERAEIKDIISYLCVLNNPSDVIRLSRIINKPRRAIGDRTVDTISGIAAELEISVFDVIKRAHEFSALSKAASKLSNFAGIICELKGRLEDGALLSEVYDDLIKMIGYEEYLKSEYDDPDDRIANINELRSNIRNYEENGDDITLSSFLEDVALMTDIDNFDPTSDSVIMMTIHSAKGLEFPVVFLPGMEENIFPNMQVMFDQRELEEERRLAYVAITRAKEKLFITHAESRMLYGATHRNRISRFADEIPYDIMEFSEYREHMQSAYAAYAKPVNSSPAFSRGFTGTAAVKDTNKYKTGDMVMHKVFGEGMIVSCTDMGNDHLLEVAFKKVGTKKLMANFSKLTKID